jgi:hypothetical protein
MSESVRSLLVFMLGVVEQLGISFHSSAYDPIPIVKNILAGELRDEDRRVALAHSWKVIDEKGVRDFQRKDALIARLAVCLLSPSEQGTWDLGEQLSWFLEVLGSLGVDVDKAIAAMEEHFDFISD